VSERPRSQSASEVAEERWEAALAARVGVALDEPTEWPEVFRKGYEDGRRMIREPEPESEESV
jgi:hypothetical protein